MQSADPPAQHDRLKGRIEHGEREHEPAGAQHGNDQRGRDARPFDAAHHIVAAAPHGFADRGPVDPADRDRHSEHERPDRREPEQHPAEEQPRAGAGEVALQVAVPGVAQLEAFEARLRPRVRETEGDRDHRPPEDRANGVTPRRTGLVKTDAAVDRARQAIAPRAIDRELAEQRERNERNQAGHLAEPTAPQRRQEERDVDRHQYCDRDQEPEQQFARRADVFEAVARDLGVAPEEAAHVGREPEAIDAERNEQKNRAARQQPPECALVAREPRAVRRRRRLGRRRVEWIRLAHTCFVEQISRTVILRSTRERARRRCALSPCGERAQMQIRRSHD